MTLTPEEWAESALRTLTTLIGDYQRREATLRHALEYVRDYSDQTKSVRGSLTGILKCIHNTAKKALEGVGEDA